MLPVVGFISCVRTSLKLIQNTETGWNSLSVRTSWNWNKTKLSTVGWNEAPTVGSFILFQFYFTMCDGLYAVTCGCAGVRGVDLGVRLFSARLVPEVASSVVSSFSRSKWLEQTDGLVARNYSCHSATTEIDGGRERRRPSRSSGPTQFSSSEQWLLHAWFRLAYTC